MEHETHGNGPDDPEIGEPIAGLAELHVETAPGFVGRLRRRIQRRELTGHVLGLTWSTPAVVFIEFVGMIFEMLGIGGRTPGGSK